MYLQNKKKRRTIENKEKRVSVRLLPSEQQWVALLMSSLGYRLIKISICSSLANLASAQHHGLKQQQNPLG